MKSAAFILSLLIFSPLLSAKTLYVTDVFQAPLRTGQTNAYRIRAQLNSGTALEVLEKNSESGYSKVRTPRGTEGWILTRHLVNQPIARDRLAAAQKKLQNARNQEQTQSKKQEELAKARERLQQDNQSLNEINSKLVDELSYVKQISGNAVNINQRNHELIQENQQLQSQVELLGSENGRLKDDKQQDFFLYGAATILVGVILGLAIPAIRPKRKDPGWV